MTSTPTADPPLAPLVDVLRQAWSARDVVVVHAARLSAGASRLTWAVDVAADGGPPVPLVLQVRRGGAAGTAGVDLEVRLLRTAAAGHVPVPEVVAADVTGESFGAPAVLTARLQGETLPRRVLRDPGLATARNAFAADCGRVLARVHALPLGDLADLPRRDELAHLTELLDAALSPHPAFELALLWLRGNRPAPRPEAVVHGDFRLGNLLLGPDGLSAVLDWELAHAGDPVEDLGWVCVRAWRFGGEPPVGGLGRREDLLAAYAAAGGAEVGLDELFWWEVLGTLRWGLLCDVQARAHLSGDHRSVELAALGRRVCPNEYDLLRMLP